MTALLSPIFDVDDIDQPPSPAEEAVENTVIMELPRNATLSNCTSRIAPKTSTPVSEKFTQNGYRSYSSDDLSTSAVEVSRDSVEYKSHPRSARSLQSSPARRSTSHRCDRSSARVSSISSFHSINLESDDLSTCENIDVPILGYEIHERKAKFTVSA